MDVRLPFRTERHMLLDLLDGFVVMFSIDEVVDWKSSLPVYLVHTSEISDVIAHLDKRTVSLGFFLGRAVGRQAPSNRWVVK